METGLTLQEAEEQLNRLLKDGICEVDVDNNGCMIYTFQGLRPKKAATSHTDAVVAEPASS